MAKITKATLSAAGEGADAVLTLDVEIDWHRSDRGRRFELVARLRGDDAALSGRDDALLVRTAPADPDLGERLRLEITNVDRVLDEDAGRDEVFAECTLHEVRPEAEAVRSNSVSGRF